MSASDERRGAFERETGETKVRVALALPGGGGSAGPAEPPRISVPDGFFGHMLTAFAVHGRLGLEVEAQGDVEVDLHHTVEDVGIALGEALAEALGERRGIARFAHAYAPLDEALARAAVDLSGRGFFAYRAAAEVDRLWATQEFPVTLAADFFQAMADRGRLTLHLDFLAGRNGHHVVEAGFKAVGLALRGAVQIVDLDSAGARVPSTKGTLTR